MKQLGFIANSIFLSMKISEKYSQGSTPLQMAEQLVTGWVMHPLPHTQYHLITQMEFSLLQALQK